MNSFKSSPFLDYQTKSKVNRNTKRTQTSRKSKQGQYLIPNPFRQCQQQNYLPKDLKSQIQDLQYISPDSIKQIKFNSNSAKRRSSAFNKHLQSMQHAAKKQEQMYRYFLGNADNKKVSIYTEAMQAQQHINMSQDDDISLGMQHCFLRMADDHDEHQNINFFPQQMQEEQNVIFYSQNNIQSLDDINNDYEAYFDV